MQQIKDSEDLYNGIVKKTLIRQQSEPFPFMSGFVDHLYSEIDEAPDIEYGHTSDSDLQTARMLTAFFKQEKDSVLPHSMWSLKDRWAKKLAIFSGRAIMKYFAQSDPAYRSNLSVVDHYDFHCEPGGGGHLENHLFCGEEGIFKTRQELEYDCEGDMPYLDPSQVAKLVDNSNARDHKENEDQYYNRLNRQRGLGLDAQSNNYVGQELYKLIEWYTTYQGVRWYVLFDEQSGIWLRVKALRDLYTPLESTGEALYPYTSWATHEDPNIFWSKAPCDDARPIAVQINTLINQEIYNREKKNKGTRLYDPMMITDIDALADERPDGLIPVDTKGGQKDLSRAMHNVQHGEITGTIDLISFLDSYHGQKSGSTPGSQGSAEKDKKVGIFFGELEQVKKRLGLHNKSFREMYTELGLRFMIGVDDHLTGKVAVEIIGPDGIEWVDMTSADLKRKRPLKIKITGGTEEAQRNEILAAKKTQALAGVKTVNPRWRDRQMLKNAGFSEDDIRDAFSDLDSDNQVLMSECSQAIEQIQAGKRVPLNRGANEKYMQKLIDYANNLTLKDKKKENEIALRLYAFAEAHTTIVLDNKRRMAIAMIQAAQAKAGGLPQLPGTEGGADEMGNIQANTAMNNAGPEVPALNPMGGTPNYQGRNNVPVM